ncbi:MAG: hypothetical protein AB7F83_02900 [Lysobacterales bacterium]
MAMVRTLLNYFGVGFLAIATLAATAESAQTGGHGSSRTRVATADIPAPTASPVAGRGALILAVLHSDGADRQASPTLQLAMIQDGKHWRGLDLANRRDDGNVAQAVASPSLAELARRATGHAAVDLDHWWLLPRAGAPIPHLARAVVPATWACLDGWAIDLLPKPTAPGEILLAANQPIEARYFSHGSDTDLSDPRWQSLRQSWQHREAQAIQHWLGQTTAAANEPAPKPPEIATDTLWRDGQISELKLEPGSGRLLHLSALRSLIDTASSDPCAQPIMVYSALLHASDRGGQVPIEQIVEVQTCAESWSPGPRTSPWALLTIHGQRMLAQWRLGSESQMLTLYELDPATLAPDPEPIAEGASSGC